MLDAAAAAPGAAVAAATPLHFVTDFAGERHVVVVVVDCAASLGFRGAGNCHCLEVVVAFEWPPPKLLDAAAVAGADGVLGAAVVVALL